MRYLQTAHKNVKARLDAKDKKILSLLSQNARMPLTKLAKEVGLSRDAVNYRIKNYEKEGIIQGYRTVVDLSVFGYKSNHLFVKLNNPSKEIEEVILKKLVSYPFVRAVIKFSGVYDFEVAFVSKHIEDLDEILTQIISDCAGSLQDYELLTISKTFAAETFPPNFLENFLDKKSGKKKEIQPDQKDIDILKLISENATLSLSEIALKVKLSADAVAYRLRQLQESGVIVKFIPVINYASLDYNLHTFLLSIRELDKEKEKTLRMFLSTDKNVLWAVKAIGRYNVLVYFLVKNVDELQETVLKLRSLFPNQINRYESLIAYEEYKYVYFPKGLF